MSAVFVADTNHKQNFNWTGRLTLTKVCVCGGGGSKIGWPPSPHFWRQSASNLHGYIISVCIKQTRTICTALSTTQHNVFVLHFMVNQILNSIFHLLKNYFALYNLLYSSFILFYEIMPNYCWTKPKGNIAHMLCLYLTVKNRLLTT
jgi:hypothetical protein